MKAVFISFNQAHTEKVEFVLDHMSIRGYSWWNEVKGRGSVKGEPRMGTHTWPEMNSALITIIPDDLVDPLLENIRKLDEINTEVGIRAFVWDVCNSY